MARILIVGGGCRGRRLAVELVGERGHAVRIVTRSEPGRATIEAAGAECLIGTPDRLATLRGALEGVTIACWMLATARGEPERVRALHGSRLESFLGQAIDTTMRGFVYEAPGTASGAPAVAVTGVGAGECVVAGEGAGAGECAGAGEGVVAGEGAVAEERAVAREGAVAEERVVAMERVAAGERVVRAITSRNAIPLAIVRADPDDLERWLADARRAVDSLLAGAGIGS